MKQLTSSSKNRNNFKIETYKVLQIYIIRIYIIYKIIKDFYVVKTKTKEWFDYLMFTHFWRKKWNINDYYLH